MPLALFGWLAWSERDRTLEEAERAATRTVWALHEHAAKVLETHELVLTEIARQTGGRSWDDVERDERFWAYLSQLNADLAHVSAINIIDAEGRVRLTSAGFPVSGQMIFEKRNFFRFHRDGGTGIYIGPAQTDADGARTIAISGRLPTTPGQPQGSFGGVVHLSVPLTYFTGFWERFAPDIAHVIPLVRSDGQIIARYPTTLHDPEWLNVRGPFLSRALVQRQGTYTAISQVDGIERLNAFAQVGNYPLHISFSIETRAVFAQWRKKIMQLGLFSALAAAALIMATGLAIRQQRLQQATSQRWQESVNSLQAEMAAREKAEAALRRTQTLDAIGQLTAGVAHDFNNLLQAIRSAFVLLRKKRSPESAEAILQSGLQAMDRGAALVRQLMIFARREKLEPCPVDLRSLVGHMGDLLVNAVGPGMQIAVEIDQDVEQVMVDPTQTEVAILNLVFNARDAMENLKNGTITIAARNLLVMKAEQGGVFIVPGVYVVLSVEDTGIGMPSAIAERASEAFFTTKPVGKGTGLGLSMVHGFVSQSGGEMRIDSEPGRGTKVSLYLPSAAGDDRPQHETTLHVDVPPLEDNKGTGTVLLVDDDSLGRLMTATELREAGHLVLEARNGEEGLAVLREHGGIDMLVTDYAMPGMNGAALAIAVRHERPDMPVVVITGFASALPEDVQHVADAVLMKPYSVHDLDLRIRAAIAARASRKDAVGRRTDKQT